MFANSKIEDRSVRINIGYLAVVGGEEEPEDGGGREAIVGYLGFTRGKRINLL